MPDTVAEQPKTRWVNQRDCKHHWVIQTSNGPKAPGRCKLCGLQRKFSTAPERLTWSETRLSQFAASPEGS